MPQFNQLSPEQGYPLILTVADPAAGAGFTLTVDTRKIIRLVCGSFQLNTDANVADRYCHLALISGAQHIWDWTSTVGTPANSSVRVSTAPIPRPLVTVLPNTNQYLVIPPDQYLDPNFSLAVNIIGGQVGDQITNIRFQCMRHWDIGI